MKPLMIAMLLSSAAPAYPAPAPSSAACAAEEMQLFYYYLAPALEEKVKERPTECHPGRKSLKLPEWLEKARPGMLERKVWRDPEEGELSEAALWQTPVSILYEFADKLGKAQDPLGLEGDLSDMRLRFNMSVDRLSRAKLEGSFGGRGRAMLSVLNMLMEDFDEVTQAAAQRDGKGVEAKAGDLLRRGRYLFSKLFETPEAAAKTPHVKYSPEPRVLPGYRGVTLPVSGSQALFLKAGDRADMLVTFEAILKEGAKEKVTATILQNVLVLKVHGPDGPDGKGAVQMLLNPVEAQYAALSLAQGSNIAISRRAAGDLELHPMEIASFRRLFK